MQSLHELQRAFCAATLFEDGAALASLGITGGRLAPEARIAVYRNNVLGNYRKALAATFPVVKRLVGAAFFDAAADHFVRAFPSKSGDVNRYGGEFGMFLESYRPGRDLLYLPDVARLEWAVDQAGIAADAPPLDLEALAAVPADKQGLLRFALHPSVALIRSPYPILSLWRVNQPEHIGEQRVDLDEGGDALLVMRGPAGVSIERIGAGEYAFLAALAAGAAIESASTGAAQSEPGFDLAAALRRHVAAQAIVAFSVSPSPTGERQA
jgi:hypothetical protein